MQAAPTALNQNEGGQIKKSRSVFCQTQQIPRRKIHVIKNLPLCQSERRNRKVGKIMVNFLMKIVSFFLPQGDVSVSESDLRTYITILQGYIIFILLAIAAVIVVMIWPTRPRKAFATSSAGRRCWPLSWPSWYVPT